MSATVAERSLPANLEAERSVLGAVLVNAECLADLEGLEPRHFYRVAHQRIYARMLGLTEANEPIDFVTLKEALNRAGELDEVGGPAYVTALADGIPRSSNVAQYAQIIRDKADLRDVIFASTKMLNAAYEAEQETADILELAESTIFRLSQGDGRGGFVSMAAIAGKGIEILEQLVNTKRGVSGIASGFDNLDAMTRGFQPGNLIIIAARPSMGKTSLAINVAQQAARDGKAVGVFSLEMSNDELFIRQLSATAHLDSHQMQSGYIYGGMWGRIAAAVEEMAVQQIWVDESPNLGVVEMRSRARRLKAEHGLDLLVIDYLQLMAMHEKRDNRTLELGAVTRALKGLAKEMRIPIILLSQLSRAPETRSEHRPILSDLRESGSIEQDADLVIFIYRDEEYFDRPENKGVAEFIIAKQRNGPKGTVKVHWIKEETRFANFGTDAEPNDQRLPMGDQ